jgi:hypothetical protein
MKIFKFFSALTLLSIGLSASLQADSRKANEFMAITGNPTKTTSSTDPDLIGKMYDNVLATSSLVGQYQTTNDFVESVKKYSSKNNKIHSGKANKAISDLLKEITNDSNKLNSYIKKIQGYTAFIATTTQKAKEHLRLRLQERERQLLATRAAIEKDEPTMAKAKKEKKIKAQPKKEKPVRAKKERTVKPRPEKQVAEQPVKKERVRPAPKASKNSIPKQPKAPKTKKQRVTKSSDEESADEEVANENF